MRTSLSLALLLLVSSCISASNTSLNHTGKSSVRPDSPPAPLTASYDEPVPKPSQVPISHLVQWPGETLSIIALWYTGDLHNWRELARANPGINPHLLYLETRLAIPEELVLTRTPMPREFLGQFKKTVKPQTVSVKKPAQEPANETDRETKPGNETAAADNNDDVLILFGPRMYPGD